MGDAVGVCLACHHSKEVTQRLADLTDHITQYRGGVSRILTMQKYFIPVGQYLFSIRS